MKVVSLVVSSALALGIVAAASPAHAQEAPAEQFGAKGVLAISSDVGLSIQHQFEGQDSTVFSLHPAADYFVIDHLSLGGYVDFSHQGGSGVSATNIGIGPRIGYDLNLSSRFSFWPKAGLAFNHTATSVRDVDRSNDALAINLFAPFLFHPVEHFFMGFGPNFDVDLTGDQKQTVLGARLVIGGWLGL
jgi:Outer membrane protein beta-barrel domain